MFIIPFQNFNLEFYYHTLFSTQNIFIYIHQFNLYDPIEF